MAGTPRTSAELIKTLTRSVETIRGFIRGLAPRERLLVGAAVGVVVLLLLDLAIVAPLAGRSQRLDRQIDKARKDLREMYALREEHTRLELRLKGMKPIPKDFSFFHHLESIGLQSGVKIDSIKPGPTSSLGPMKETTYDVKIDKVSLFQLVDLLYRIERNQDYPLKIKRISIRPQTRDRQFLEVSFQIVMITTG